MGMPRAEWSKAGEILMHTPGEELFNGVIHPSAGLFEDYFDVNQAAAEHRGYIEMLRKNGIRVHTVIDILEEVGIDSLRALAAKVLTYDISSIAGEDAQATEKYRQEVLGKMSRADLIRCILLQPYYDTTGSYHLQHEQQSACSGDGDHQSVLRTSGAEADITHTGQRSSGRRRLHPCGDHLADWVRHAYQ